MLSDANGLRVEGSAVVYAPFGEIRVGEPSELTDFGFTGQRLDSSTGGLMYYGARYYLPELRRFMGVFLRENSLEYARQAYSPSPDTIVPGAANPQALNRYSYVLNSPLTFIDPTGHFSVGMLDWGDQQEYDRTVSSGGGSGSSSGSSGGGGGGAAGSVGAATSGGGGETYTPAPGGGSTGDNPDAPSPVSRLWDEGAADCMSGAGRQAAELAFQHFLEDPWYFADVYLDPSSASDAASREYADLDVFAMYSILHTTADELIWQTMVDIEGIDFGMAMDDDRLRNLRAALADDPGSVTLLTETSGMAGVALVMTMDQAIELAAEWAGPSGAMGVTPGSNYYFWSETSYPDGSSISWIGRLDVNPAHDRHVQTSGSHLNLEVQYRSNPYARGQRVSNTHIRILADTVRMGDHP